MTDTTIVPSNMGSALLDVEDLAVVYPTRRGRPPLRAVDGVSFHIGERETVGLVGESGSGKSTIGRAILGLTDVAEGHISFDGRDVTSASKAERRRLSSELQVVFQDPYSSLNPTRTIHQTLAETLLAQGESDKQKIDARVHDMLVHVGMPQDAAYRYPTSFSGGQRQRIAIARALMASPRLVICDEPTSALDLSVQAQVLNLMGSLQQDLGLSYVFISHDLAVVRHIAHRLVVLYRGRIMEAGDAATVYANPTHPYTRALIAAAPVPDPEQQGHRRGARIVRPPSLETVPLDACPFAPRCPFANDLCRTRRPVLETTPDDIQVACHRWKEIATVQ